MFSPPKNLSYSQKNSKYPSGTSQVGRDPQGSPNPTGILQLRAFPSSQLCFLFFPGVTKQIPKFNSPPDHQTESLELPRILCSTLGVGIIQLSSQTLPKTRASPCSRQINDIRPFQILSSTPKILSSLFPPSPNLYPQERILQSQHPKNPPRFFCYIFPKLQAQEPELPMILLTSTKIFGVGTRSPSQCKLANSIN